MLAPPRMPDLTLGTQPPRPAPPLATGSRAQPVGRLRLSLAGCRQAEPPFGPLLQEAAREFDVEARALGVRVLLHLPRVANPAGVLTVEQLRAEMRRSAVQLQSDRTAAAAAVPDRGRPLGDLVFGQVDAVTAERVFSRLHYLRSHRDGAVPYGLLDPDTGLPVALCSLSRLEWKLVGRGLARRFGIDRRRMWDVSRVYAFDLAPPNAISYLLARVRDRLRQNPPEIVASLGEQAGPVDGGPELLVTAVDPNLGFTGSSYRAANWQHWMNVQARPYVYRRHDYISPRQLRSRFGTANVQALEEADPGSFQLSRTHLEDSMIYCCRLSGTTEVIRPEERDRLRR